MHLPVQAASAVRCAYGYAVHGGVTPSQCQCELRSRGNRTTYVVDERNSHCGVNTVATCNQANGACNCNPIAPVARPRHFDFDYRGRSTPA